MTWAEILPGLDQERLRHLESQLAVSLPSPYVPIQPTAKQLAGLLLSHVPEVLYGGAAGGAKSWWLMMEALRYVNHRDYAALLIRGSYTDLEMEPDGLIPISHTWLDGTPARWESRKHTWRFPSGATLGFGHLTAPDDHLKFAGPAWQMIGLDQAEQMRHSHYTFMFSRLRRRAGSQIPIRFRATANPKGRSVEFLKERFNLTKGGPPAGSDRAFLPAKLEDNPHLDRDEYERTLRQLDPVDYQRLRNGDWTAAEPGSMFKVAMLGGIESVPPGTILCRAWDLAATEPTPGNDPDYTVGALMGRQLDRYFIQDIVRDRVTADKVEALMYQCATRDGTAVPILIEQEPGASGKMQMEHFKRLLRGWRVHPTPPSGSKTIRAGAFAAAVNEARVAYVSGHWNEPLVTELRAFPTPGAHDDQVDSLSMAFNFLDAMPIRPARVYSPADERIPQVPTTIPENRVR